MLFEVSDAYDKRSRRDRYMSSGLYKYNKNKDRKKESIENRLLNNSVLIGSCIKYTKSLNKAGYGRINIKRKIYLAHRISYQVFVGEIPDGMSVCHKCDNPSCVNPNHLFLGTQKDNMNDCKNKKRSRGGIHLKIRTHCNFGHEFSKENTLLIFYKKNNKHYRGCRECKNSRNRVYMSTYLK